MAHVPVPKDLSKVKTKVAFNLKADIFSRAFETVAYGKAAVSFCLKHFDTLYPMQSAGAVYWEVVIVKKGKNEYIQIRNTLSKKARLLQGVITAIYMNCQII